MNLILFITDVICVKLVNMTNVQPTYISLRTCFLTGNNNEKAQDKDNISNLSFEGDRPLKRYK